MRTICFLFSLGLLPLFLNAQAPPVAGSALGNRAPSPPKPGPVVVHQIQYTGTLAETKASFVAVLNLECTNQVETVLPLFTGDLAVTGRKLPEGLRLDRSGKGYLLTVTKPGEYQVELDILAKITKADPWRKIEFTGPTATIGGVSATVAGDGLELELLSGTPRPRAKGDKSKVSGALGADRKVSLRWQAKVVQEKRDTLMTVQTVSTVQITPTVIKYTSVYNYDILQGKPTNVVLRFPASQSLTSVKSDAPIRDRREAVQGGQKVLTIDFIKPLEKKYRLTLLTEQPRAANQATASLEPPEPRGVQRERGQLNLKALDMKVEPGKPTGLSQVNAAADTLGAWQFFGRENFGLQVALQNIDPELSAHDVVRASLEEKSRQIVHTLTLTVEKAGIYTVTLTRQAGLMVTDVRGDGISDWKENGNDLEVEFAARVLGQRQVTVVLEEMADALPAQVTIEPLQVADAKRQTAQISVMPARGLEIKTAQKTGLREAPARRGLAFTAAAPGWSLAVTPRQLPPRVVAQVSNGVVIGDNRVYGFAKIFYAISDQGVDTFHVRVPAAWENVQFLGTRKRRDLNSTNFNATTKDFTLTLQDLAWDQYTLQVSYDLQLDDNGTTRLNLRGAHPMQKQGGELVPLERDSGTLVIHSVDSIKLGKETPTGLSRTDHAELEEHVRSRINHTIQLAYKYDGTDFSLELPVSRKTELDLLNAVADYAELTTVVTGIGQVATTATLSVKKTDKENPRFKLPTGGEFISCRIDGVTVKPGEEKDAEGNLVYIIPLPEDASRSQMFRVQISYSETHKKFKNTGMAKLGSGTLKLSGPVTLNIKSTYSRWNVYVPDGHELYGFEGNMVAPKGRAPYTLATAWYRFNRSLRHVNWVATFWVSLMLVGAVAVLMVYLRRGRRVALITSGGIVGVLLVGGVITLLSMGGMAKYEYAATGSDSEPIELHDESESMGNSYLGPKRDYALQEKAKSAGFTTGRDDDTNVPAIQAKPKSPTPPGKSDPSEKPQDSKTRSPSNTGTPGGGGMGGGGIGGIGGMGPGPSGSTSDAGTVTGVLPPEFHIPVDRPPDYVFTKALNLAGTDKPLEIVASIMDRQSHRTRTGILQWLVALAGLGLLIQQGLRKERCSYSITGGIALLLGGIGAFMVSQGTLHLLFLNALWVLALAVLGWATWFFWPAQRYLPPAPETGDDGNESGGDSTPPADDSSGGSTTAATAALLLLLTLNTASAGVPAPKAPVPTWEGLENLLRRLVDPNALPQQPGGPKVIRESQLQDRNGTWFEINQDAPYGGQVVGFFQNRQKRIESNYSAGQLHGAQSLWFDNGQKRQLTQYQKGQQHGAQSTWYRSGQKASDTNYQKDRRHGQRRAWHANGKLAEETAWVAGELHGLARHWHDNGKIAREVRWDHGRQLAFDTWTAKGVRMGEGTNSVSMVTASYKLNVHREVAQVEAEFNLSARAAKQKFTLFREVIAVDEFTCSQAGAKLLREGPALVLYLPDTGEAVVKMKFLVKHAGDGTKRTLGFGIPSALTSNVDVVLQDDDSEVDMPTAVTFNATSGGNQTLVDAVIGASDRLELTWKPQVQKAKEIKATVFVQTASTVAFGNGVVQARTVLDYTVAQGELNEVKVKLPAEKADGDAYVWTLMKVDGGKMMRNYFEKMEDGERILTVQLDKGVPTGYQLTLELERTLPAGANDVPLSLPVAKAGTVNRETGFIALQSSEDLDLSPQTAMMKVDAAEFTRRTKQPIAAGAAAYGYTNPSYSLTAGVKTILPEIEATARHLTAISDEQLRVITHVAYTIKRVGVFQLKLLLPADEALRVEKVAGPGNPQWEEKTVDGTRQLMITLKKRTKGFYPLRVELVKPLDALPGTVTAEGAHPVHPLENRELKKLTHHVGVYGEEGVVVKLAPGKSASLSDLSASKLTPVAAVSNNPPDRQFSAPGIPDNAHALAYQFIDTNPDADRKWNVTVTTEAQEPWVRNAQLVNWVKVGNTRVTGRTRIRYEVERASARRFTVMLPLNINTNHVKFTGANIRGIPELKATPQGNLYTITLQDKVRPGRDYLLNIDWELTDWDVGKEDTTLAFRGPVTQGKDLRAPLSQPDFTAAGMVPLVEGEEGWLVISDDARSHLTMKPPAKPKGWDKKNTGELPEWARDGSDNARLVYYYFRPGHPFNLVVKKLKDAEVEPAWISQANFTSVITEDGQMLTRMTLDVNNHGKPTLGITLPVSKNPDDPKPEILSVFVNGQAVRPTQAGEQFEVALENSSEVGNFPVEVVYTSRVDFPRIRKRVVVESPTFDVKLNNAHWWLYLPRDFAYSDFEGTMDYTDARAMKRRVTSLDVNKDGRLDQKELEKDSQYGWLLGGEADGRAVDLSKAHNVNPRSGASIGYSFETYQGQQQGNAKKELDNIAKQQAFQELNLDANNLSAVNRFNDQSLKSINQLAGKYRGPGNERDSQRLSGLLAKQKELESKRRGRQIQEEQRAQDEFTFRNTFDPFGGGRNPSAANATGQASGQQAANPARKLVADAETVERQGRQIDEINRIQQRVTSGEVTPLNINLPLEGVFLAFSQPLQTVKGEAMEISFEAESTRRTNWWNVAVWSLLGIAALYFLVNAIRLFALQKPRETEA